MFKIQYRKDDELPHKMRRKFFATLKIQKGDGICLKNLIKSNPRSKIL